MKTRNSGGPVANTLRRILLAVVAACSLTGCPPPEQTARHAGLAYLHAIAAGDGATAWALLGAAARGRQSRRAFVVRIAGLPKSTRAAYERAADRMGDGELLTRWQTEGDQALIMRHRPANVWEVAAPLPRFERSDTPRDAMRAVKSAIQRKEWRRLMSLAPAGERKSLHTEALAGLLGAGPVRKETLEILATLLDEAGDGRGDAEHWRFTAGAHRAEFVQEQTGWKLAELR